jgi:hypothetical protein
MGNTLNSGIGGPSYALEKNGAHERTFKVKDHVHLEWVKVRRLTHITRSG